MFGVQSITLLNTLTIDLFLLPPHTTAHLPPNHTIPPHYRTLSPFTQDLTPDPVVDMDSAVHAQTANTWKTDKYPLGCHGGGREERPHTIRWHGGGESDNTCPCP